MSFIAECTFCNGKVRVPDGALGLSVPCPRCGNSFTLAADAPRPETSSVVANAVGKSKKSKAPLATMTGPSTRAVLAKTQPNSTGAGSGSEEYVKQVLQTNQLLPAQTSDEESELDAMVPAGRRKVNYFGVASLILCSLALLTAQVSSLTLLVIPLACIGFLAGIIGLWVHGKLPKSGLVYSAAGSVVSLGVLVVMGFFPEFLGIEPDLPSSEKHLNPNRQQVVGLHGGDFKAAGDAEWVDAGKASFQHGPVRVRVLSDEQFAHFKEPRSRDLEPKPRVYVKRVELQTNRGRVLSEEKYLVVYLRLINAQGTSPVVYKAWGGAEENGSRPRLRDNHGKVYRLAALGSEGKIVGQLRKADLLPGKPIADMLVFEAPEEGVGYLRLELPASALGGKGNLRLHIPAKMIE
jgi:hypothetical protein